MPSLVIEGSMYGTEVMLSSANCTPALQANIHPKYVTNAYQLKPNEWATNFSNYLLGSYNSNGKKERMVSFACDDNVLQRTLLFFNSTGMHTFPEAVSAYQQAWASAARGARVNIAMGSFPLDWTKLESLQIQSWQAFTVAQQRMELLSALPTTHPLLTGTVGNATAAGTAADAICSDIPLGTQHMKVDGLGLDSATGQFEVCYRITDGNPLGSKKNVRVVALYGYEGNRNVILQTIR